MTVLITTLSLQGINIVRHYMSARVVPITREDAVLLIKEGETRKENLSMVTKQNLLDYGNAFIMHWNLFIVDSIGSRKICPLSRGVRYKEVNFNRKFQLVPENGVHYREVSAIEHDRCRVVPL